MANISSFPGDIYGVSSSTRLQETTKLRDTMFCALDIRISRDISYICYIAYYTATRPKWLLIVAMRMAFRLKVTHSGSFIPLHISRKPKNPSAQDWALSSLREQNVSCANTSGSWSRAGPSVDLVIKMVQSTVI